MADAVILTLEECRDAQRCREGRQRLHDRFDRWLQRVEDQGKEPKPTLAELTEAVFALRQEWTQAVTEGMVEHAHRAALEQRTAVCPQWGQTVSARSPQERLDYRFARKGGYPMGSGGIESANQFICHVRLKRSGAWWDCDQRQPDAGPALRQLSWHL